MTAERARFTVDGSAALEAKLSRLCERITLDVRRLVPAQKLEGLLLGGGYGRGEGGVLQTAEGDKLYNDLEFYVLLRGNCRLNEKKHGASLRSLAHELEAQAEVELEFKIISRRKLERHASNMFFYDLLAGHRLLWGPPGLLENCGHHLHPENIPLAEATRLLMNRCSGLLFSMAKLKQDDFREADADFVGRNQAKAQLAFGDVLLTVFGQYHSSCRERLRRLEQLAPPGDGPSLEEARSHHRAGVEFKLHPQRSPCSRAQLAARQGPLLTFARDLWLWLESRRLGRTFSSPRNYAESAVNKCPETSAARNGLINAATFGLSALRDGKRFRYPRERILEALALLLWEPDRLASIQNRLGARSADFQELVGAYQKLWRRFN